MRDRFGAMIRRIDFWLLLAVSVGAALRFSRLGDFDNQYYTATVASMLKGSHNFLYGSFDPGGVVTVDKPPFSFWVQAIPVALFGPSRWAVTLPQTVAGTLAIVLLYAVVKPAFGRVAAVGAAFVLAVLPASVIIDSRNEPDSLLSFTLLLAAFCIIRAAKTRKWPWLIAFSVMMGIAFNIKMLVAFVPLPAFLLYYAMAANLSARKTLVRLAASVAVLLVVSLSWVTAVSLTPAQERPYIGSTRDNSIWTLTFKYNGLDRFTSFIGPRPAPQATQPVQLPPQQSQAPLPYQPNTQPQAFVPTAVEDAGIFGLFTSRIGGQAGWLLPLGLFMLLLIAVPLLSERVYQRPAVLVEYLREAPAASQTVLWGAWFLTAVLVFGLANATTTHPYYLVGLAVPLAAVVGIGLSLLWQMFSGGRVLAWVLPGSLLGIAVYQVASGYRLVGDWAVAVLLVVVPLSVLVMAVAIWRAVTASPLAKAFAVAGGMCALLLPAAAALQAGGNIAVPNAGVAGGLPPAQQVNPQQRLVGQISSFVGGRSDRGSVFAVAVVSAREAAPFIVAGVPAVAIGGFSGGDPVFNPGTFKAMADRGEVRYFLMPATGQIAPAGALQRSPQQGILDYVRREWEDVSRAAGLPLGAIYRYGGQGSGP